MVKFTVYGEPKAKGRPRVSVRKSADGEKTFARAYTPKNTVMYENQVKAEYGVQCDNFRFPDEAMLDVRIFAFYGIPKSVSKKKRQEMIEGKIRPVKKPDFDNIAKVICDSLNGIAYRDDAMIVDGMFRKYYSEQPRVEVKIMQIGGEHDTLSFAKGGEDEVAALVAAFSDSKNFKVAKLAEAKGELEAVTQTAMTPGTDPETTTQDYSNGFVAIEPYFMNTACVDTEDTAVHGLLDSFLDRIFDVGQLVQGCVAEKQSVELEDRMAHAAAFNTEKMVYVLNSALTSTTYGEIEGYQAAAKVAGMIAAVAANASLTHTVLDKVTELRERLTPTQMTKAEQSGCLVLSVNKNGQIWIDNAINTLVTPADNQDEGWKKIRRTKTRYEMITRMNDQADSLIGKVDNDTNGRATIISQLQGVGDAMIEEGKLTACTVAESSVYKADGDSAWFEIDCIDKDSAEHIYLMYAFRFSTQE